MTRQAFKAGEAALMIAGGVESAENVALDYRIEREAQDRMALASQLTAVAARQAVILERV